MRISFPFSGLRFASFAPAHLALRAAFGRLPSQRPLACVQVCLVRSRSSRFGLPLAGYPASARWHVFQSQVSNSGLQSPVLNSSPLTFPFLFPSIYDRFSLI
jgi:hypothetical protein